MHTKIRRANKHLRTNHNACQNHLTNTKFAGLKQRNTICQFFIIPVPVPFLQDRLGLVGSGQNILVGSGQDSLVGSGQDSLVE